MTATEDLRRMLGERWVKWKPKRGRKHDGTEWYDQLGVYVEAVQEYSWDGFEHPEGKLLVRRGMGYLTPEQAIAATLGNADLAAENAKLREERDHWHVEQVHAYGNWEDAHKRATELEAENAKLRKLLGKYHYMLLEFQDDEEEEGNHSPCPLYVCPDTTMCPWDNEPCPFVEAIKELGIEADE